MAAKKVFEVASGSTSPSDKDIWSYNAASTKWKAIAIATLATNLFAAVTSQALTTTGAANLGTNSVGTSSLLGDVVNVGTTATTVAVATGTVTTASFGTGAATTNVGKAAAVGSIYTTTTLTDYVSSVAVKTYGAGYETFGAVASAAASGSYRAPHGWSLQSLINAGGTTRNMLSFGVAGNDLLVLGDTANGCFLYMSTQGGTQLLFRAGGSTNTMEMNQTSLNLRMGSANTIATTGTYRSNKNQSWLCRNEGDSANLTLWAQTATDVLALATDFTTLNLATGAVTTANLATGATTTNIGKVTTGVVVVNCNTAFGAAPSSWNTAVGATFYANAATAPNASPVDGFYLYSLDLSAGNTMLGIYSEGTAVAAVGIKVVNETLAVKINGVTKYIALAA